MKKIIAILLSAAMILSLAGCSKEEETTKKKKKTKKTTADTEDTTEDPTDDPTDDPTEDPTTEPTDDPTTDTSAVPVDTSSDSTSGNPDPGTNPVQSLHTIISTECAGYGNFNQDEYHMDYVKIWIEYPEFTSLSVDTLEEKVYSYFSPLETAMIEEYDSAVAEYTNGTVPEDNSLAAYTYIFRDDTYIFSYVADVSERFSQDGTGFDAHSFFTETGEEITLSDVVKDFDAVLKAAEEYHAAIYGDSVPLDQAFVDSFKAGKAPFTLTYDGICLFSGYSYIKVPLSAISDAVDLKYFGNTPDSYFLNLDSKMELYWDIDGDGQEDSLSVEGKTDSNDMLEEVIIHHNGQDFTIGTDVWGEFHAYDDNYVMVTEDGIYMYLLLGIDEAQEYVGFSYENGAWTGIGTFENGESFYGQAYDPSCVYMSRGFDLIGSHYFYSDYYFEGNDGKPELNVILFNSTVFLLEATQDIPCYEMDKNLNVTGEGTIPKGACVNVAMYDPEYNQILLEVSFADYTQNYYVSADVSASSPYTISGIPINEAFDGIFYGG